MSLISSNPCRHHLDQSACWGLGREESVHVQDAGFRMQDSGFRVQNAGFRVQGSGFRVQGAGFRVQGSGFRVQGPGGIRQVYLRHDRSVVNPGSGSRVQCLGCSFLVKGSGVGA